MKKSIGTKMALAAAMLALVFATTSSVYAQVESGDNSQVISGDETITETETVMSDVTNTAECNGEGATCDISQEGASTSSSERGPIVTSRSNLRP